MELNTISARLNRSFGGICKFALNPMNLFHTYFIHSRRLNAGIISCARMPELKQYFHVIFVRRLDQKTQTRKKNIGVKPRLAGKP